ncbi:MAG: MAPEG family protein [Deltaproteobacteria bacterium]|nr:MAPEG family protein [Deltaproteobacteria bacterium]
MTAPVITALYGALNAILNIVLANRVSTMRKKHKVSVGLGEHPELLVASRVHGNNAEFVPLAIVMMLIAELLGGNSVVLHVYGGLLLGARVLHVVGMPRKAPNPFRFLGVALTWAAIVGISGWILYLRTV